jgi:hypothetical protein
MLIASRKSFDGLEQHEDGSLVFTTKPDTIASDRQVDCYGTPVTWNGSPLFSTTAALSFNAAGGEGNFDLDTVNFWTNWMGSTESFGDALRLDLAYPDMREASGGESRD